METVNRELVTFLLNSLWQVPLIAGVAALACRLMRQGPASHRHAVWVAALFAAVLLPLASVRSGERIATGPFETPAAPQLSVATAAATSAVQAGVPTAARTISYAQTTASALLLAYLLFVLYRLGRLTWAGYRTAQIRGAAVPAAAPSLVRGVWERCLAAFRMGDVELLCSPRLASPVAAGAWRRSIILPEPLFAGTSEEVLTTAIGHEMAHLARHDFALNVLYELLSLPVAFHPATWLILRGIEETREMACDELVTRKLLDAGVYARSILSIAASMTAVPRPGYTLGVFDGDILEQRIRGLLHRPAANLKRARLLLAGGLSAVALCAVMASGIALTARAQTNNRAQIAVKLKSARELMNSLGVTPGDVEMQRQARQTLLDVLSLDPGNQDALSGMLNLSMVMKQPTEARQWALRMVSLYPKEKTSQYCLGFADWSVVYPQIMAARAAAGIRPQDANFIPDAATRQNLRTQWGSLLDEGVQALNAAIQADPYYSDAMAYVNLIYRLKANIAATQEESTQDVALADQWVGKALDARRNHPSTASAAGTWTVAPPPPPPPPPPMSGSAPASDAAMPVNYQKQGTFWQVLGAGPMSAKQLIDELQAAGFPAGSVRNSQDEKVRVVVGPYQDDASLAGARTRLEAAGYRVIRSW